MSTPLEVLRRPDGQGADSRWEPMVPEWEPETPEQSQGWEARRLWEEELAEFVEVAATNSRFIFTGIGGAVASVEREPGVTRHKDGSELPSYVDLKEEFGQVPELLFLVASPKKMDNLAGLVELAKEYKEQGVIRIIAVLTAFPHERQDHQFYTDQGHPIRELTMLKAAIRTLTEEDDIEREIEGEIVINRERCIDAGLIIGPHSLRPVELARRKNFPLLPIDPCDFMCANSGFDQIPPKQRFVMGPDKGRRTETRRLATRFNCPFASATKKRARLEGGYPTLTIEREVKAYIKEHNCIVFSYDDEIRNGGTTGELAKELDGHAQELRLCVFKPILAGDEEMTAVDHLSHPLITKIITTDAVEPLTDVGPIEHKLRIIPLRQDMASLIEYLRCNLVKPGDPSWLKDPSQTGTLLGLDLRWERYDEES